MIVDYRLPFFKANNTIITGPDNMIIPVAISCPITCQLSMFKILFIKVSTDKILYNINSHFTLKI